MQKRRQAHPWGTPPWAVGCRVRQAALPVSRWVDFAIVGAGFTGLAVACWLRRLAPLHRVAVLEASQIGAGASGRSGGIVLDETAAGPLPGLGNVLESFVGNIKELDIDCDLSLTGAWELARTSTREGSPISWQDSGLLRVASEVPGGTVDPGLLLSGLARYAQENGATINEHTRVRRLGLGDSVCLELEAGQLVAAQVALAVDAAGADLLPWPRWALPKFTLALATAQLSFKQLSAIGQAPTKPFYTLDLPYLWGRPLGADKMIFGGGLVHLRDTEELNGLEISRGEAARLLDSLQRRIRGLHSGLANVEITRRWGGPIIFPPAGRPIFCRHPEAENVLIVGGYSGHGVALSIHLGRWAAEALLGKRDLPVWGRPES